MAAGTEGRLALVTGGGSLLGRGIGQALAADGWRLVIADIDGGHARSVAEEIGGGTESLVFDVRDRAAVDAAVTGILARHGRIDALVNAAGGMRGLGLDRRPFMETTPEEWALILQANFNGLLNCTGAVLPSMIARGTGSIVSIAAGRGLKGGANAAVYSAAKAAIIVFSQSLAQEVGPRGIRVNTVAPGNAEARWKTASENGASRSPLGRPTSAADVGNAVAFLVSDRAGHITGSCLDVSGGTALH